MSNTYPRGKLNAQDEGQLGVTVFVKDKTVMIEYSKLILWVGMDKSQALALAKILTDAANLIELPQGKIQ